MANKKKLAKSKRILEALRTTADLKEVRVVDIDKTARQFKDLDLTTITIKLRVPTASLGKTGWVEIDDDHGDGNDAHADGWTTD